MALDGSGYRLGAACVTEPVFHSVAKTVDGHLWITYGLSEAFHTEVKRRQTHTTSQKAVVQKELKRLAGQRRWCCQTNELKHQYSFDAHVYEITKERHSVKATSKFSLKVLRVEVIVIRGVDIGKISNFTAKYRGK